jgi:hypothetical protein
VRRIFHEAVGRGWAAHDPTLRRRKSEVSRSHAPRIAIRRNLNPLQLDIAA